MLVNEYALSLLHAAIRADPWVRAVFLAAGGKLDELAERILAVYNQDNFDALNADQCAWYEGLLGLSAGDRTLAQRRAAIQAAWNAFAPPTLESIQAVCDGWDPGAVTALYSAAALTVWLQMSGGTWQSLDMEGLRTAVRRIMPAHLELGVRTVSNLSQPGMYAGTAGHFVEKVWLTVEGDVPDQYTILADEAGNWLIDEIGALLLE